MFLNYFKYASRKGLSYGVIDLDAQVLLRQTKESFFRLKNYGELVKDSIDILTDKGTLIAYNQIRQISSQISKNGDYCLAREKCSLQGSRTRMNLPAELSSQS